MWANVHNSIWTKKVKLLINLWWSHNISLGKPNIQQQHRNVLEHTQKESLKFFRKIEPPTGQIILSSNKTHSLNYGHHRTGMLLKKKILLLLFLFLVTLFFFQVYSSSFKVRPEYDQFWQLLPSACATILL